MVTKKKSSKITSKKSVKKTTPKRVSAKKAAEMRSFHLYKEKKPFVRFGMTRQTLYWLILLVVVVVTQLWILKIQMDIASLTTIVVNQ